MISRLKPGVPVIVVLVAALAASIVASEAMAQSVQRQVTQVIDERAMVELSGNIRPQANAANDRGAVDDNLQLEHMQLLLNRPAAAGVALEQLIAQLHDPKSTSFHQWLTAEQFATQFGPATADVTAVSDWLSGHGLTVNGVQQGNMVIDFSGTAQQVQAAFRTAIHHLDVDGVDHIANMSDPHVPAALAGVIGGVVSLHDFRPHANFKSKAQAAYTFSSGGSTFQAVVPADLATIYNLNPLFKSGVSGQGQTIVVIEDTDVFSTADWSTFRSTFGLSTFASGSLSQVHPAPASGRNNCSDPGVVAGDEMEAELDAEWASASAPGAAIELASCADTRTTFGGLLALQNLVGAATPPAIVSISYGECETENGATANAAYKSVYQQAVAEGVSVFVSAGDEGAAGCDPDLARATHGIGVSGFASTPYNVAVGGTEFADTYAGSNATYWGTTNGSTFGSALSYIPEIPWNDSCAGVLLSTKEGFATPYGASGFCNSAAGSDFLTTAAGSGGPSGCATGSPSRTGIVGGTCKGYAKPSWQTLVGNPADGVRDLPDVSLFAANGLWGHYYVFCDSDAADGGTPCTGAPSGWVGAGGTSFAAPIWAGFQALVDQKTNARQGNPNPVLYALAAREYGASGSASCNSTRGISTSSSCVFYDVTLGDIDVNCTGSAECYGPSGRNGVLSTSSSSYAKAYGTGTGWDFSTGIGTVNVTNLVNTW